MIHFVKCMSYVSWIFWFCTKAVGWVSLWPVSLSLSASPLGTHCHFWLECSTQLPPLWRGNQWWSRTPVGNVSHRDGQNPFLRLDQHSPINPQTLKHGKAVLSLSTVPTERASDFVNRNLLEMFLNLRNGQRPFSVRHYCSQINGKALQFLFLVFLRLKSSLFHH